MSRLRLRGGFITEAPIPPTTGYGTDVDWIKNPANVGPRSVGDPGGGVTFDKNSNMQALIDGNGSNTTFRTTDTGTFTNFQGVKYYNKHAKFYFVGPVGSQIIDGGGGSSYGLDGNTNGVEVHGGTWQNYGSLSNSQTRAINCEGGPSVIQDVRFLNNAHGTGGYGTATPTYPLPANLTYTISHCSFKDSYRWHFNCVQMKTFTIEYSTFENANTGQFDYGGSPGAGTCKIGGTEATEIKYCWIFNTPYAPGFWWDGANADAWVHDCVIEDCVGSGIFYEISHGGAVFEHNYLRRNGNWGGGGSPPYNSEIQISCSPADDDAVGPPNGTNHYGLIEWNDFDTYTATSNLNPVVINDHTFPHPTAYHSHGWKVRYNKFVLRDTNPGSGGPRVGFWDSNRAWGDLSAAMNSSQTSFTVSAYGSNFPPLTHGLSNSHVHNLPFIVEIDAEDILVGARSGNTFSSLTRGYDGTTAAAHSAGARMYMRPTGLQPQSLKEHLIGDTAGGSIYDYNEYWVADTSQPYWEHDTRYQANATYGVGPLTWTQFRAMGNEAHGTLNSL